MELVPGTRAGWTGVVEKPRSPRSIVRVISLDFTAAEFAADTKDTSYSVLFKARGFTQLLVSTLAARIATQMFSVLLVLFVLETDHSAALSGLVVVCSQVPGIIVSPLAGALLDRGRSSRVDEARLSRRFELHNGDRRPVLAAQPADARAHPRRVCFVADHAAQPRRRQVALPGHRAEVPVGPLERSRLGRVRYSQHPRSGSSGPRRSTGRSAVWPFSSQRS